MIIATLVHYKVTKTLHDKILKQLQPFIEEIGKELHDIYLEYASVIKIVKKYDLVKRLKEAYGDDIEIEDLIEYYAKPSSMTNYHADPLSEKEFIDMLMHFIANDIRIIMEGGDPSNECYKPIIRGEFEYDVMRDIGNILGGGWDEDEYTEYLKEFRNINKQLAKLINNKYKSITFEYDFTGNDYCFKADLRIKCALSKKLLDKIMQAIESNK